jgi:hypothetical protein
MLDRILPARIDNRYRAHVLALWRFVPIAFMKVGVSLAHRFEADGGAQSVSTMPLDTSPPSAVRKVDVRRQYAGPGHRAAELRRPRSPRRRLRPSFVPPAARWALASNHGRSSS